MTRLTDAISAALIPAAFGLLMALLVVWAWSYACYIGWRYIDGVM